jgi:glycosyltransferase involved in cell wall biosynthesis
MVSILLATYNGEKFIKQSIDSIINQSFKNWELLIGINGTIDNTKNIVESYKDDRIKIFEYDEKGKAKTLNKLLKEAKYDWIALQDDDDVWVENKLIKQINFCDTYDIIGSFIIYIDENNNYIGTPNLNINHDEIIKESVNGNNNIANTSAIFKKYDALVINGWQENLDGIEDYDFWLRLIKNHKLFINLPEVLVLHRLHTKSKFNNNKYNINKILNNIRGCNG